MLAVLGRDTAGRTVACSQGTLPVRVAMRDGSGYALGNAREFDAWGNVRSGASSGLPNTRYCASLGHKQDDESGLIYMRARYYEPTTGRFISEDPAARGINWFAYAENDPVGRVDPNGEDTWSVVRTIASALLIIFASILLGNELNLEVAIPSVKRAIHYYQELIAHADARALKAMGGAGDLGELYSKMSKAQAELGRIKMINRARIAIAYIGYIMILKALLLDIEIGPDGQSGLELVFGHGR